MAKSKEVSQKSAAPVKGGKGKMFGRQHAGPQVSGETGHKTSGDGGKWGKGGKTKMFSKMEAGPQKPGQTAPGGANAPEKQFASGGKTKMFGFTGSSPAKPR